MKDFTDKAAIATGGGGDGIGHHVVMALARQGAKVAFCDIARLDTTQTELAAIGADYNAEAVGMGSKAALNR